MEANAALKSIVRRDNGQSYNDYLKELAKAAGIENQTRDGVHVEIAGPGRRRPDADGFVGLPHMHRAGIGIGINRDGADAEPPAGDPRAHAAEREALLKVLEQAHWRIRGKDGAAEILGLKGTTLQSKMKKLGIERPATL